MLLIHEIEYVEYLEDGRWGDTYADSVPVRFVRVEPATALDRDSAKEEVRAENILFLDGRHTKPFVVPKQKDKIIFQGREYEVSRVEIFYAISNRIHHIEAELV